MRVLVLGNVNLSKGRFPEGAEIAYAMTPTVGKWDVIFLSQWIQQFPREQVVVELRKIKELLANERSELFVTAPALEWVAAELLHNDDFSMPPYLSLYGTRDEPYKSGFKMAWLRMALEQAGFVVRKAVQEMYTLIGPKDEKVPAWQNVCIAVADIKEEVEVI